MKLWIELIRCIRCLRDACSRQAAFLWMTVALCAWAVRPDLLGVTSLVRASFLHSSCYQLLLHFFHSSAVALPALLAAWLKLALKLFSPVTMDGFVLLAADGLKVAKEGRKMPSVKCLHQESSDNSKPQFIMGHSFQVLSMLVAAGTGQVLAVPLVARICEGLLWGRSEDHKTILDKLADIFLDVAGTLKLRALLVADAYYGNRKIILPLLAWGHHLISRVRKNTVAYHPATRPENPKRGRPKKYGRKVRLTDLFRAWQTFSQAPSPVYGERDVVIQYRCLDLLWRPVKQMVRFVLVKHPTRGRLILICTKLDLDPLDIIKAYGLRFKIEVSFKSALHNLGTYAYHFWMRDMRPIRRRSGNQNLNRQRAATATPGPARWTHTIATCSSAASSRG